MHFPPSSLGVKIGFRIYSSALTRAQGRELQSLGLSVAMSWLWGHHVACSPWRPHLPQDTPGTGRGSPLPLGQAVLPGQVAPTPSSETEGNNHRLPTHPVLWLLARRALWGYISSAKTPGRTSLLPPLLQPRSP